MSAELIRLLLWRGPPGLPGHSLSPGRDKILSRNDKMGRPRSLTEGNIFSSLIRFAVPVLFTLFLQALYGGVDLLVVASLPRRRTSPA